MKKLKIYKISIFTSCIILLLTVFTISSAQDQTKPKENAHSKYKHHTSTYGPILACNGAAKDCFVLDGRIHVLKEESSISDDH